MATRKSSLRSKVKSTKKKTVRSSKKTTVKSTVRKKHTKRTSRKTIKKPKIDRPFKDIAKILTDGKKRSEMLKALEKLQGRARVLVELAQFSKFKFLRLAAVSQLADDLDALIEIAKFAQCEETRLAALEHLSHIDAALAEVAAGSLFKRTRLMALDLIMDDSAVYSAFAQTNFRDVKDAALSRMSNEENLKKVVLDFPNSTYARRALSLIDDVSILASLVISQIPLSLRKEAASKIEPSSVSDPVVLTAIAKYSPDEEKRYLALEMLSEYPWLVREVAQNSIYQKTRSLALMLLSDSVRTTEDVDILTEVAIRSPYKDCRQEAVKKLEGKHSALMYIANNSKFSDVRKMAVHSLKDNPEALKSVLRLARTSDVRKRAHELIANEVFPGELPKILG